MGKFQKERKITWQVRYSAQAQALIGMLKDIDLDDLEDWVLNRSSYSMIGDAHILAYIHEKSKICPETSPTQQP